MRAQASSLLSLRWLSLTAAIPHAASAVQFRCPTCGQGLAKAAGSATSLTCPNGHYTDVAKEGHVHLMPSKRKKVTKEEQSALDAAVRAERAFYEANGFAAQIDSIAQEVVHAAQNVPGSEEQHHVLNIGCGEGVYLRRLQGLIEEGAATTAAATPSIAGLWGTDTSKLAARYAAKRQPDANIAVAMPHCLPFADGVFSVVFCTFASAPWEEICRVLRPGGAVVVARAGNRHLQQLRTLAQHLDSSGRAAALAAAEMAEPKQFSSGLAEHYLRCTSEETFDDPATMRSLLGMTKSTRDFL